MVLLSKSSKKFNPGCAFGFVVRAKSSEAFDFRAVSDHNRKSNAY